jgi:CheY-like chemotaxis protein
VLYTTGYAQNAIIHDGRLDPGVELITKPFSYVQLAAKLRDLLDGEGRAPCVLVVEDEALVRMAAVDALKDLGFRVEEAASSREAIGKVRILAGRIDAAIIDVGLPDRKGDALAAELRAMSAELPIVMASGYLREAAMARFDGDRLVGFVGKPYDRAALASALRALGVEAPAA